MSQSKHDEDEQQSLSAQSEESESDIYLPNIKNVRANEKSSLFEFKQWIKGAVFMPDKHMSVTVDIVNVNDQFLLRPLKNCSACRAKWEDSNMVEAIRTVHWGSIGTLDLSVIDPRLVPLASSIRAAARHSYSNGQSKSITMEIVSLVRVYCICQRHSSMLNINFPNDTKRRDEGAVEIITKMKAPITPPTTEDEQEGDGDVGMHSAKYDEMVCMKGNPDLIVLVEMSPALVLIVAENKKVGAVLGSKRSWRESEVSNMLGQVLFYLTGHQLEALKYQLKPCPKLGLYMQDGVLQTVISQFDVNGAGTNWKLTHHVSKEQSFGDGGLAHVVNLVYNFLSQNVVA